MELVLFAEYSRKRTKYSLYTHSREWFILVLILDVKNMFLLATVLFQVLKQRSGSLSPPSHKFMVLFLLSIVDHSSLEGRHVFQTFLQIPGNGCRNVHIHFSSFTAFISKKKRNSIHLHSSFPFTFLIQYRF